MAQHDFVIDNASGRNVRLDLNDALMAIVSNNSGDDEPEDTFPRMWWVDTTNDLLKIRNPADDGWITLGTIAVDNLGLLTLTGGTLTGRLFVANVGAVGSPDIAWAGDTDTGLYSPGANLLGLVAAGTELLRADGVLGYLKALGTKGLLVPAGTTGERPAGVAGLFRYNSTLGKFEGYHSALWKELGGGGGGAGFSWRGQGGTAPIEEDEYGERVFRFNPASQGTEELYASLKVPASYASGSPISVLVSAYSPSPSNTILLRAQSTLIKPGTTAFDATTNQRTTTNAALTNSLAKQAREFILDVTSSVGQINGVDVVAGDIIKVRLYRDTDTDSDVVSFIPNATDVKYS